MDNDSGITFYSFIEIYKNHKLTLGEIKHVFTTADMNKDNQVDATEWKMFYKLFVKPFERCDADLDYTINSKEMEKCIESKYLNSTKLTKDDIPDVINSLDRNAKTNLTFIDYLFLRRVNLAWKECTTDFKLSVAKLDCALEVTVPGRRVDLPEADQVFQVLAFVKAGKYKQRGVLVELKDFIYISHLFYYFSAFELPFLDGYLNRKDILRAIENQQLASSLTPSIIDDIFESDKQDIDFMHFTSVMYVHQLFQRYCDGANFLNQTSWEAMLTNKQPELPPDVLELINSNFIPDPKQALLSDKIVVTRGETITEKDFLINFLQQKATVISHRLAKKKLIQPFNSFRFAQKGKKKPGVDPKKNMELFFKILDVKKQQKVYFPQLLKAVKLMWAFYNFDTDCNGFLIDRELREGLMKTSLPVPFTRAERAGLNECLQFLSFGGSYRITFKEFLDFMFYNQMFESLKAPGTLANCLDADLRKGFD